MEGANPSLRLHMKKSIASLKDRLVDWVDTDMAMYELGVCLGFWSDFGAPHNEDPWHGMKSVMWINNDLGTSLNNFLEGLVIAKILEKKASLFRWNQKFKFEDIL